MASAGANAERQAKAQATVNAHMERIGRATGIQPPPPIVRVSHADERSMADTERTAAFMGLVADALDPSNAGKTQQLPQSLGGVGEYNAQEEEAKAAARAKGEEDGTEEPTFRGRALSEFDGIADEDLTNEEGVGEATAAEIVKARRKRERAAERAAKGQ